MFAVRQMISLMLIAGLIGPAIGVIGLTAMADDVAKTSSSLDSAADAIHPENQTSDEPQQSADKKSEKPDKSKRTPQFSSGQPFTGLEGFDLHPCATPGETNSSLLSQLNEELLAAEVHVKLGASEHGSAHEFELARQAMSSAIQTVRQAKLACSDNLMRTMKDRLSEIEGMKSSAGTTFFGQFPLVRAFGLWPEDDEEFQIHSYSRQGEARRRAVYGALTQIAKNASTDPLHLLILVPGKSVEDRRSSVLGQVADSQALEAMSIAANISVYPGALRNFVDAMPGWNAPDAEFDPICRQFLKIINPGQEPRSVLLVLLREFVDDLGDGHWVQAQQRMYEAATLAKAADDPASLEADKIKVVETLTRDRSRFRYLLGITVVLLYLASLASCRILTSMARFSGGDWQRWLAIPTSAFLVGWGLTPFIMRAMNEWLPKTESDAWSAAWWPCMAGALSLILPAGVFRLVAGAAGRYLPGLSCHGRWGIVFIPVALGVSAAWFAPTCYAMGFHALYLVVLLAAASSLIVYSFGRAVDIADEFPLALAPVVIGLSLLFGAAAFMASGMFLCCVIGLSLLTTVVHQFLTRRNDLDVGVVDSESASGLGGHERPRTIAQLRQALNSPRYFPPTVLKELDVSSLDSPRWVALSGPAAAGKSVAAQYLIEQLLSHHPQVQVLEGHCIENSPPFQPIRDAFADLGAAAGIIASSAQGGEMNTIFERLADEFIPFWDFFSMDVDSEGAETSRRDLLEGVLDLLQKITQRRPVVLFLDDIQWMDEGSIALLKHLREHFAGDSSHHPLMFLLTSRDPDAFEAFELSEQVIELTPPSVSEQAAFLQTSFGIEAATARHLVSALGVMNLHSDSLFWLTRAVSQLVEDNALTASPAGFRLREQYLQNSRLPVPDEMRAKLGEALRASGQYLPVLECAALLGEKFRVSDVSDCLKMDRLQLLQILRHLEHELQLVRDITQDQDCYAFSSQFMLEIVREELGVTGKHGGRSWSPSKIARELHARIGAVLESRSPRTTQLVYDLAHHYHAAGAACASKCVDYCLVAADIARSQGAFRSARVYLGMAEEGALMTRRTAEVAARRKQIAEDEAASQDSRTVAVATGTEVPSRHGHPAARSASP